MAEVVRLGALAGARVAVEVVELVVQELVRQRAPWVVPAIAVSGGTNKGNQSWNLFDTP